MPARANSIRRGSVVAAVLAAFACWPGATLASLTDAAGSAVPATDWSSPRAQIAGVAGCEGGVAAASCRLLGAPGTPGDDDPAALEALGSPASPEDDLDAALARLAAAQTEAEAAAARDEALAILEGDELPGRVYSGIPLLNWNPVRKVRRVPSGGEVTVTQVRTPGHSLTDTWLLDFEDPARPFTIRYRISELGGVSGGQLAPAALLSEGDAPLGGIHSSLWPLTPPSLATGTRDASRFTAARGMPAAGAPEATRSAVQEIVVRMPPAGMATAILDASGTATPSLASLRPATADRIAHATALLGVAGGDTSEAERRAAIERLAPASPERLLWEDLRALPPASDPDFLAAARALGRSDAALVASMRGRTALPAGVPADPAADVTVVLQNNESYVSAPSVRPRVPGALRVRVVNRDGFPHRLGAFALHDRRAVLGALDWGRFEWRESAPPSGGAVAAGEEASFDLALPEGAFAAVLGDLASGDQAASTVALETGPVTESVVLGRTQSAEPRHSAVDAAGRLWVSLSGADALVRVDLAGDLRSSEKTEVLLPGGAHSPSSEQPPLEPADVAVDARGIVWSTLVAGNAIARIDPALIRDGTSDGVRIYPLAPCGDDECAVPFPPPPGEEAPTRQPLQMEVRHDAAGDTTIWYTQAGADRIGLLRAAPDGTPRGHTAFPCGCDSPLGIGVDEAGDVWFTEGIDNRVGRLTPDPDQPHSASAARLRHYRIPSAVTTVEPDVAAGEITTSLPHSLAIDTRGLIWVSESATGKLAVLDPAAARPNTSDGFMEIDLPANDFDGPAVPADLVVDPAGTVFWTDEYGDQVGTVNSSRGAPADWRPGRSLRPVARRSLTDSPIVTPGGDLLYIESAAGLLVRVRGVAARAPAAAPGGDSPGGSAAPPVSHEPSPTPPPAGAGSPDPAAPPAPAPATARKRTARDCPGRIWLGGTRTRPQPAWLGGPRSRATECLGRPRRVSARVWRYPGLALTVRSGRVNEVRVTGQQWRDARGALRVGAPARVLRTGLPRMKTVRPGVSRTLLAVDRRLAADVEIRVTRGRISSIRVRAVLVAGLDRRDRALLRRSP